MRPDDRIAELEATLLRVLDDDATPRDQELILRLRGYQTTVHGPANENSELLRRLDAWTEDEDPGPLIRWAAAHLRGEAATDLLDVDDLESIG